MSVTVQIGGCTVVAKQGDITAEATDAVVNAANSSLMGGGGVDGAIHRAGGPEILEECKEIVARIGSCPTGEAVITTGGRLPARHVIHTVGPVWNGGRAGEPDLLANAYRNSLDVAAENGIRSIAFPSISTGVYGYPIESASQVAIHTVLSALASGDFERVHFVLFSDADLDVYEAALARIAPEYG